MAPLAAILVGSQHTQLTPQEMPGWINMEDCSQLVFDGGSSVSSVLGCSTWLCVCNHFPIAMGAAQSLASSYCSHSEAGQDIASATSVLNALCSSISATVAEPTAPTSDNFSNFQLPSTAAQYSTTYSPVVSWLSSPTPYSPYDGCVLEGNDESIGCSSGNVNIGGRVTVNISLLFFCLATATGFLAEMDCDFTWVGGIIKTRGFWPRDS